VTEPRKEVLSDTVTLWLGDCREVLPLIGRVDHIITDPPYSELVHSTRGRRGAELRNDGGPDLERIAFDSITATQTEISALVQSACGGWFLAFSDIFALNGWRDSILAAGGKSKSVALWVKPDCAPQFNGQKPATAFECIGIFWCGKGFSRWNGGGSRGLYVHNTNGPNRDGVHPTEKPVPLMADLISLFSNSGEAVCDPFMGSGTTGVACVNLGRSFIGIEREPKYFDIARRRITQALSSPRLPFDEPIVPKQEVLL
jgi:site-specific DNA-methyltransferase (adenine-specific)